MTPARPTRKKPDPRPGSTPRSSSARTSGKTPRPDPSKVTKAGWPTPGQGAKGPRPPQAFLRFGEEFGGVAEAYGRLGDAVHAAGPLDERTRALVKLAISTGAGLEGAVHSHARKAVAVGATPDEIRQVVVMSLPTIGLPSMMAALSWVNDILDTPAQKRTRG